MKKDCSVIILAAGKSSRMGKPKLLLRMPNQIFFLENIANQYAKFGCTDIIVVLNKKGVELLKNQWQKLPQNIITVLNTQPELGRFSSIKLGAKKIKTKYSFLHNIDNPIVNIEVLNQIFNAKSQANVVKPVINNRGGHPVLLSKSVCDEILIEKGNNINLKDFLKKYSTKRVEVNHDSIFLNINTPKELNEFLRDSNI